MNTINSSDEIYTTAPDDAGRLPKEMAVYALLDRLSIPYERLDHDVAETMEACAEIDQRLGVSMCKNLFLRNQQKTTFYLLLMPGEKKFKTKDVSKQLGISRLSFAEAEYMEQYLNITPGSVSVLGLMNDTGHHVHLIIDKELLENESIGCHPCINTSSLKIKTEDILNVFLKHTGHTWVTVEL
nr:prolyl-tRNA synthetase associated domain-containing protein [uncultured Faecalimonas sp.]